MNKIIDSIILWLMNFVDIAQSIVLILTFNKANICWEMDIRVWHLKRKIKKGKMGGLK